MLNNTKFNKIYDDLHDDHVSAIFVYIDEEKYICADPDCTERLDAETVKELFIKRKAVGKFKGDDARLGIPVGLQVEETGVVYVSILTSNSSTGEVLSVWVHSKEYVAE